MNTRILLQLLCLTVFLAFSFNVQAAHKEGKTVIKELKEAEKSKDPIPLLNKAKQELEIGKSKKKNRHQDVIAHIDQAIEAHKKGDHKQTKAKIKEAIKELKKKGHKSAKATTT